MNTHKPKSLQSIENRMLDLDPASFRFKTLEAARDFKSSWIALGQYLFAIQKDKFYKEWGYLTFEAYCAGEVGIRQNTAVKLLRSYSFLEREEPAYLKKSMADEEKPNRIPSYESVNTLRLAKQNGRIAEKEYEALRESALEKADDDTEVKKKVRYILKKNPVKLSPEDRLEKRGAALLRVIANLKRAKEELVEFGYAAKALKPLDAAIVSLEEMQE